MDWKLILICVFMVAGFSLSQFMSWRAVGKGWQEAADERKAAEEKAAEEAAQEEVDE